MLIENDPVVEPESTAADSEDKTAVVPQTEEEGAESSEVATEEEGAKDDKKPAEREEYEIFLEGEEPEPEPKDSAAYARMRLAEKEAKAEAARLKRELEALRAPAGVPDPGPEPTSDDDDVAYDEVKLKAKLRKWDQAKAAFDGHKAKAAEQEQAQAREVQTRINAYVVAGEELSRRVPGYVEAEKVVASGMSEDRKVTLLKYAENAARVVYFLGRNPERLEEFARENDLGRFVAKLAKLEVSMKERKKTQAPPPEQSPRGSGAVNAADSTLEKLRAKAEKTGDYAPVNAYKRKQRANKK